MNAKNKWNSRIISVKTSHQNPIMLVVGYVQCMNKVQRWDFEKFKIKFLNFSLHWYSK